MSEDAPRPEVNPHALNLACGALVFVVVVLAWQTILPVATGNHARSLRLGDGWPLRGYLLAHAAWIAVVGTLIAAPVVELLRRKLDVLAGCVVMVVVLLLCLPALCGEQEFLRTWRWAIFGGVMLLTVFGVPFLARGVRAQAEAQRHGRLALVAAASCALLFAAYWWAAWRAHELQALTLLTMLGLQGGVALCVRFGLVHKDGLRRAGLRRAVHCTSAGVLLVGALAASGLLDRARFSHSRWVAQWGAPALHVFVDAPVPIRREWRKVQMALGWFSTKRVPMALSSEAAPQRKLHVFVIVIDALRRDHSGPYVSAGEAAGLTPHLDAVAVEGTVYDWAYSPAPGTGHSLPAFLTGLNPRILTQMDVLPNTLPGVLRQYGYVTQSTLTAELAWIRMTPLYEGRSMADLGLGLATGPTWARSPAEYDTFLVDLFEERVERSQPLAFEYVHLNGTHGPFAGYADYRAAVRVADAELGRMIAHLKAEGLWDSSVVIITADHGEALGEHGMHQHANSLYEEQVAVPLVVRVPGQAPGRVAAALTLTELPSIVMEALGGRWEDGSVPEPLPPGDYAVQEHHHLDRLVWRSVRSLPYVYHHRYETGTEALFDLSRDPGELEDLSATHPEVLSRLRALEEELDAWEARRAQALNDLATSAAPPPSPPPSRSGGGRRR